MNSDEVNSPLNSSAPSSTGRRIRVRPVKRASASLSQEVSHPSITSDDNNDWVSPFTLPPLPALKKHRSQVNRSPEARVHDRSGSSAYYAAAWGSPYATPSPSQSPALRVSRNRSLHLESSPLTSRKSLSIGQATANHARQQSLPVRASIHSADLPSSPSPTDSQGKSSRRIWLSESEDSDSEQGRKIGKTPTQSKFLDQELLRSSARSHHHVQASVDTITPETFNGTSSIANKLDEYAEPVVMADMQAIPPSPAEEKPLPSLPTELPTTVEGASAQPRPTLPPPAMSFNRPKRKVPWKGKSCIIAMPLTDRGQAGLPPVLSAQERQHALQKWIDMGYPIHGFHIGDWYSLSSSLGGASRPPFPDAIDMETERKSTQRIVRIPNQGEWEAWVQYLREEKLRALGVTPSTSEAPPSTISPFSSTASRVSSVYPGMAPSPPIPTRSAPGMRPPMSHSPFSPSLSISNPTASGFAIASQRGTPGLPNSRPMHGYTQSVAFPGMSNRMGSPFGIPSAQAYQRDNVRSPDGYFSNARRPWTPGHVQNMQSMANLISPVPPSTQDSSRGFTSNYHIEAIQRQQAALARQQQEVQYRMMNHHRQMSTFPQQVRAVSTEQVRQLPVTPQSVSPEREPPKIMQPTPRSHRHNRDLSAALERGVTGSVAASTEKLSKLTDAQPKSSSPKQIAEELDDGEVADEEEKHELPILHRPETLKVAAEDQDEIAEIETNPSIPGTPLLLEDKSPFANFTPLLPSEPPAKRPDFGHSAQPSFSKLNVQAKEFSPSRATFPPTTHVFDFDGNALASHTSSPGKSVASASRLGHRHNPSSQGLNVAAAAFTPSCAPAPQEPPATVSEKIDATPAISEEDTVAQSEKQESEVFTSAKSVFDPPSSAFSFGAAIESVATTPAKSSFDPRSSTHPNFSFRSTAFNVDAPEFKPSGIPLSSIGHKLEEPVNHHHTGTIFGEVFINPLNKPERRTKALPVVKPASRAGSAAPEQEDTFDADGRVEAPVDRNKRARKVGGDDDAILFADTAPFKSLGEEMVEVEDTERIEEGESFTEPEQQKSEAPERMTEVYNDGQDTQHLDQGNDRTASPALLNAVPERRRDAVLPAEAVKQAPEQETEISSDMPVETFAQAADAENVNALSAVSPNVSIVPEVESDAKHIEDGKQWPSPRPIVDSATVQETATMPEPDKVVAETAVEQKMTPVLTFPAQAPAFKPSMSADAPVFKPSALPETEPQPRLSALAPSFDFQPAVQDFVPLAKPATPPEQATPQPKKGGLMASKFANSPAPEPEHERETEHSKIVERNPSPLQELFGQAVAEAASAESTIIAKHDQESSCIGGNPKRYEAESSPPEAILNTLERWKDHDSRSDSAVSQTGDMSYEEINAVMKQFEENPGLDVIREDTPVKSTPLIDMRYPQQFRSDAPSPTSNRRLDGPFNPDQEQPYKGLGFELSGVHQLNYGTSGEVSDWNADLELSPGQQDKLESRAHFFDEHVNDMVDNILESRLAPLESALQNIQLSLQQAAGKPRHSRRSMSTDKKDSDADDEDDYNAYEGYSLYRSRSPHKRNGRSAEKIKAAVLEAMTVAQSSKVVQVDMSSIQSALGEMLEVAQKATVQPQQPVIDLNSIQSALLELKGFIQQDPKPSLPDTSELTRMVAEMKSFAKQRAAEPQLDAQMMQATLDEIRQLASAKPVVPEVDLSVIQLALEELRRSTLERSHEQSTDLRSVLEEVISCNPILGRVRQDDEGTKKLQEKISDLEEMLRVADKRADGEASLRREAEEECDNLQRRLQHAKEQNDLQKAAAIEAQKSLQASLQEKHDHHRTKDDLRNLELENDALKKTLDEYRHYKDKVKAELETERGRTDSLARALQDARHQHQDQLTTRDSLREQLSRVQERVNNVMQDFHHDQAEWQKREHDLVSRNQLLQAALDHETNRRARVELETEKITEEHRESLHYKSKHDAVQDEVSRLAGIIVELQSENKSYQDTSFTAQRELAFVVKKQQESVNSRTDGLQAELDATKSSLHILQSEAATKIAALQGQLDSAALGDAEMKTKHELNIQRMFENHNMAIQRAEEKHAAELEQRLALHEEKLIDLKKQYSRDIYNANEDRKQLEHRYVEKLDLKDEKIRLLEGAIKDLEARVDIANDAARTVAAVAAKSVNLPTPAPSVVASPPQRASVSSASMSFPQGSELPEKISPQALRETIMVLQEQLQNREQKIDKLEGELAAIDKDAPNKVKERDTEIVMLRELLDVRVEDLQVLIDTLEKTEYDQASVKDAAIRLKTQIRMERQLKERQITGANLTNNLPVSITSGLVNLTQSPRAMVAAAAWGNWKKVRDSGVGSVVSDFASNIGSQTPSRSSSSSSVVMGGTMTPPATKRSPSDNSRRSTARPLAAASATRITGGPAASSPGPRPLRTFGQQPRALGTRRGTNESRPGSSGLMLRDPSSMKVEPPSTPLQLAIESDFGEDVDEDASPLDGKDGGFDSDDIDTLVRSDHSAPKVPSPSVSPRKSRSSSGKPVSPQALRASANANQADYVEVIEED